MKNKPFRLGVLVVCLAVLIITSAGCGDGEEATSSPNGQVSYKIILDEDIQTKVQTGEGMESLPEEVCEWVETQYQTEMKDSKEVDGSTYVLIARGESSSSGYGIEVEEILTKENTLHVRAKYTNPGKNEVNLMVLTYPVLLIKVEGTYSDMHIEITDETSQQK